VDRCGCWCGGYGLVRGVNRYRGSDPTAYVTGKLIPDLKELVDKYQPDDILVDGEW
jgi:hypothetical protein